MRFSRLNGSRHCKEVVLTSTRQAAASCGPLGKPCLATIFFQAGGLSMPGWQSLSSALRMLRVTLRTWVSPGGKVSTLRDTPERSSSTRGALVGTPSSCRTRGCSLVRASMSRWYVSGLQRCTKLQRDWHTLLRTWVRSWCWNVPQ